MCLLEILILLQSRIYCMIGNDIFCFFYMCTLSVFYVAFHTAAGFIIPIICKGRTRR